MAECFLVDDVLDCWEDQGVRRVGAMVWRNHGRHRFDTDPRPMPHLAVMTPAGLACLDCPATTEPAGRYWQRSGEPPAVTVTPSLDVARGAPDGWHGYLTAGVLA